MVPHVGGKPFLRKPPLVQWCIAGSLKIFGYNVWAARLPSALSVLALVAVIIFATRGWLISEQSLVAAIVMMAQIATIEKCRLAELEAIYVALSGIAIVLWMSWWSQGRSPWLVWIVPMVFNALALLAKAPLHFLFFYAVVIATLVAAGEIRTLWSRAHLLGVLIMASIVAAWAVPFLHEVNAGEAGVVWRRQFFERVTDAEMNISKWLMTIPNGLANHLPWVLFAPLLWRKDAALGQRTRPAALLRGGRWAVAGCFFGLLLIPGVQPRNVQPLVAPFSVLLAPVLWACPRRFRHWWRYAVFVMTLIIFTGAVAAPFIVASAVGRGADALHPAVAGLILVLIFCSALLLMSLRRRLHQTLHLTLWTGFVAVMTMLLYTTIAVPWMSLNENIRPFAQCIDDRMPANSRLVAYSLDDFAPLLGVLFHLKTPFIYVVDSEHAPDGEEFYLMRGKERAKFETSFTISGEPLVVWYAKEGKFPSVVVRAVRKQAVDCPAATAR